MITVGLKEYEKKKLFPIVHFLLTFLGERRLFVFFISIVFEMSAIIIFMPESLEAYMHPFLFCSYMLIYLYLYSNYFKPELKTDTGHRE